MDGGSAIEGTCIYSAGGASISHWLSPDLECDGVRQNAPPVADPYAEVPEPEIYPGCDDHLIEPYVWARLTLTPYRSHPSGMPMMRFCNDVALNKPEVVLDPGLYIFDGAFKVEGATRLSGEDVTLFFADGGKLKIGNGSLVTMTAPATGPYAGLLFFASRTEGNRMTHEFSGAAGSALDGAFYFPSDGLHIAAGSGTVGGCLQVIADTVRVDGGAIFSASCRFVGEKTAYVDSKVSLVE